ncbi:dienelactone hydrolase [Nodosilinea sp. LEGE 07088]|uniref:alpha/beta hydrolase family protein n=1 Tax=Nodosilinea sp. LEGE 07088 TaxID=2777968 RepID=UPI001880C54E|nr:dienelactone hydrolase [Nodosilinea sp. LEGE 07088]MBE9141014.1 dienelactone hydrolase [Nodosilinea sp. LEGE 07088]
MTVRALFRAVMVDGAPAPYNTIQLKVFYPAQMSGSEPERNLGVVPADSEQAPFPIVILFNGINCGPELYRWLAIALVERGLVAVTFSWVAENLPGLMALTPGVDLAMLMPDRYGQGPTASALPALLNELETLNAAGVLAGLLDLNHVILGGHSAGGRVAIESASPEFFPSVCAAFAYGAHTAAIMQLGYEAGKILPLPDRLPLLLMGGTQDGVIANSSDRYGITWERPTTPIERTFHEAIRGGRDDCYLLSLEGANHFSFVEPFDATTGRAFLDFPATQPAATLRELMAAAIGSFVEVYRSQRPEARESLVQRLSAPQPLIAHFEHK